jgi:hypothetical protein
VIKKAKKRQKKSQKNGLNIGASKKSEKIKMEK